MKIAIVGTTSHSLINFRLSLIKLLVKRGHRVVVLANDFSESQKALFESLGVVAINFVIRRSKLSPFSSLLSVWSLFSIFRREKVDASLCFFVKPALFGSIAGRLAGVKNRVALLEGMGSMFIQDNTQPMLVRFSRRLICKFAFRFGLVSASSIVVLNQDDRYLVKDLVASGGCDVSVLFGIGVDLSEFAFKKERSANSVINFLYVGRLLGDKGLFELVCAASHLKRVFGNKVSFTVVGDIDEDNASSFSQSDIDAFAKDGVIDFVGSTDNVLEYYQACSVFVLPSYREGMPRSIQEAMSVGRAIVATDVEGCRDAIMDGFNGVLVRPRSWSALASGMAMFVNHPELIEVFGDRSRIMAEQLFDQDRADRFLSGLLEID